jgi:hypothetical protein
VPGPQGVVIQGQFIAGGPALAQPGQLDQHNEVGRLVANQFSSTQFGAAGQQGGQAIVGVQGLQAPSSQVATLVGQTQPGVSTTSVTLTNTSPAGVSAINEVFTTSKNASVFEGIDPKLRAELDKLDQLIKAPHPIPQDGAVHTTTVTEKSSVTVTSGPTGATEIKVVEKSIAEDGVQTSVKTETISKQ